MDFVGLDRDIEEAALSDPLTIDWEDYRHVSGQRARGELGDRPPDPLRDALIAWITWLTVARVAQPAERALAEGRASARAIVHLDKDLQLGEREVVSRMLAARSVGEAKELFGAWAAIVKGRRSAAHLVEEVRAEAFHRLAIDDVPKQFLGLARADIVAGAERFLATTEDLAKACTEGSAWPIALDVRFARGATEGWPSHLVWRTVAELLPGAPRLRGMKLPEPPKALGASSFARALETFGQAFRRASIEVATMPFVLREPPLFVDAFRTGYVFAALLGERAFHTRMLGLAPGRAHDQARLLVAAFLLHARVLAARVLPERDPEPHAARAEHDGEARFVALATMLGRYNTMREREGDDWFRNPRAFVTLRELFSVDVAPSADCTALARRFEEELG
jgi:hypothetical protein